VGVRNTSTSASTASGTHHSGEPDRFNTNADDFTSRAAAEVVILAVVEEEEEEKEEEGVEGVGGGE
jgi:hypothetical protein